MQMMVHDLQDRPANIQMHSVIQLSACIRKNISNSSDLLLREVPIVILNSISDTGKVLRLISIPCLWCKNDMLELLSAWKLYCPNQLDGRKAKVV